MKNLACDEEYKAIEKAMLLAVYLQRRKKKCYNLKKKKKKT